MSRNVIPAHWTPIQEAAWRTVHDYSDGRNRGANALAPRLGKSAAVLSNEVNPDSPGHKLGLEDAVVIQAVSGDHRILEAFASTLHHVAIPLDRPPLISDVALLDQFARWQARMGATCERIRASLEDGRVSRHEADGVHTAAFAHVRELLIFLDRLSAIAEEETR